MVEIDNTPLSGSAWATEHVSVWLVNASDFERTACTFADNLDALRGYVADLLYMQHRIFTDKPPTADQVHNLALVRNSFTREDFDGIDWAKVRDALLRE